MESIDHDIETIRRKITQISLSFDCKTALEAEKANRKILDALQSNFDGDINVEHDHVKDSIIINCYAYALGLGKSDLYRKKLAYLQYRLVRYALLTSGVQSDFISFLLEEKCLQEIEPRQGCLVIYFNQKIPKHAGILIKNAELDYDKIVQGRLGNFEAIVTHRLLWVDFNYGSTIKYYKQLNIEKLENYFLVYLKEKRMNF